jgi:hypothetical protein
LFVVPEIESAERERREEREKTYKNEVIESEILEERATGDDVVTTHGR